MQTPSNEPSGVIIIDKASGMTSHDVVGKIRKLYNTKKVGHTGTLDPLATGVLVVLVGRAAKAAEYLVPDDKRYLAGLRLGLETDTEDISGTVLKTSDELPDEAEVMAAVADFIGDISQTPPMYSALKVNGQKLVDLARRGITLERESREIHIDSIEAKRLNRAEYTINVECSKGTYIRTLCADIGKRLGCGAVMSSLRRERSGNFTLEGAYTLDALGALDYDARIAALLPTESLFNDCPSVGLIPFYEKLCRNGAEIYQKKIHTDFEAGTRVRICGENGFFALGEVRKYPDGSAIKAIKLFELA